MAGVLLIAQRIGVSPFFRPGDRSGVPAEIPLHRLLAICAVLPPGADEDYRPPDPNSPWCPHAVVDTGAPLSLFPYRVWRAFEPAVTWLEQPPAGASARRVTLLGGSWGYRLGRVRVGLTDVEGRWLSAARINAWFLDDAPAGPRQAVLGLRCPLFDRRRLRQEPAAGDEPAARWWFEDG